MLKDATLRPCVAMVGLVFKGWVFTILWGWFVVKTFSLPSLSIPEAIGLALVIFMLVGNKKGFKEKPESFEWVPALYEYFGYSLVTLLVGYVVSLFL